MGSRDSNFSGTNLNVALFDVWEEYVLWQRSCPSAKCHCIDRFAHLLGFVEPVDLIKEYDRLSIGPSTG